MTANAFGRRNSVLPFSVKSVARGFPIGWLAIVFLMLSVYGEIAGPASLALHSQEMATTDHGGDSSHSPAECDGGVVCSTFFIPTAHGGNGRIADGSAVVAADQPLPQILSPKLDPPPPRHFV